jgi:hypothetical protein
VAELGAHVRTCGLTASVSDTTIWRWLSEDAIRPWQHRCWIFPRDPDFEAKAGRILDLYQRIWKGRKLGANEFVLSADEKTSIQARCRKARSLPPQPRRPMKIEHEYKRLGAWAYLAALDVHRAKLFGRCESKTGIAAFDRLVDQVMKQRPYRQARRVFWIVDNGSAHPGAPRCPQASDEVSQPGARSWTRSRQLAEPNRNLFLHRPTKNLDAKRLPYFAAVGTTLTRLRTALPNYR